MQAARVPFIDAVERFLGYVILGGLCGGMAAVLASYAGGQLICGVLGVGRGDEDVGLICFVMTLFSGVGSAVFWGITYGFLGKRPPISEGSFFLGSMRSVLLGMLSGAVCMLVTAVAFVVLLKLEALRNAPILLPPLGTWYGGLVGLVGYCRRLQRR